MVSRGFERVNGRENMGKKSREASEGRFCCVWEEQHLGLWRREESTNNRTPAKGNETREIFGGEDQIHAKLGSANLENMNSKLWYGKHGPKVSITMSGSSSSSITGVEG